MTLIPVKTKNFMKRRAAEAVKAAYKYCSAACQVKAGYNPATGGSAQLLGMR